MKYFRKDIIKVQVVGCLYKQLLCTLVDLSLPDLSSPMWKITILKSALSLWRGLFQILASFVCLKLFINLKYRENNRVNSPSFVFLILFT